MMDESGLDHWDGMFGNFNSYPPVNVYITMGDHQAMNRKTHERSPCAMANCNKLPEGSYGQVAGEKE